MLDFNDAPEQIPFGELIPNGTIAKLQMNIRPGGEGENGILKASKSSDAMMLDVEFTVVDGPFARRKFWQNMVVSGGNLDDNGDSKGGKITKSSLRAILESSRGIAPTDMSAQAMQARKVSGYHDFENMIFIGKIGVQKSKDPKYPDDKNQLSSVMTPDKKEYKDAMAGIYPATPAASKQSQPSNPAPAWAGGNGGATTPPPAAAAQKAPSEPSNVPSWAV